MGLYSSIQILQKKWDINQTLKLFVQATWEVDTDKEWFEGMPGKHELGREKMIREMK